jgi:hypothetical protein
LFAKAYTFSREVAGRLRRVEPQADLLNCWWSAFGGPQTPEAIVRAHLHMIDDMIAEKLAEGLVDPHGSDPIVLTSADYETEFGDDFELSGPLQ